MPDNSTYNEKELFLRIADGDEASFTILFEQLIPQLQPAIIKWVGTEDVMKDVIQETFIRVWMHRDQLSSLDKPVNWIFRVAANECFTWLNKQALRSKKIRILQESSQADVERDTGSDLLLVKETRLLIANAVAKLPPQRKLIYELHRHEGLRTAEIAKKLHLSPGHVRNELSSSLQFIREYLVAAGKVMAIMAVFLQ